MTGKVTHKQSKSDESGESSNPFEGVFFLIHVKCQMMPSDVMTDIVMALFFGPLTAIAYNEMNDKNLQRKLSLPSRTWTGCYSLSPSYTIEEPVSDVSALNFHLHWT